MTHAGRCHVCTAPTPERRHARVRRVHAVEPSASIPERARLCPDCRAAVLELTRHWEPREPMGGSCSFCDEATTETGLVELVGVGVDGRPGCGTYLLCRGCEGVFGTFLSNLGDDAPPRATAETGAAGVERGEPT
jgi:hypothetical protein